MEVRLVKHKSSFEKMWIWWVPSDSHIYYDARNEENYVGMASAMLCGFEFDEKKADKLYEEILGGEIVTCAFAIKELWEERTRSCSFIEWVSGFSFFKESHFNSLGEQVVTFVDGSTVCCEFRRSYDLYLTLP
jgi:hypothetical protein